MAELFLPTLHTFAMNNIFTGSKGLFRFRAEPKVVMANPKERWISPRAPSMWSTGTAFTAMKRAPWRANVPSP